MLQYKVLRDDGYYGDFEQVALTTARNYSVANLSDSTFYRFGIQAENVVGWGEISPVFRTQVWAEEGSCRVNGSFCH